MTSTNLLCEFLTNPFGDEQKTRELLSEIDNRPLSDAELERGLFCFQIAFYFLACLAITARVEDPTLQKTSIDQLNDRARAFYARKKLQVQVCELVVSPAERDRGIAVLCHGTDAAPATTTPATTMLALFDLVVAHRLREYVSPCRGRGDRRSSGSQLQHGIRNRCSRLAYGRRTADRGRRCLHALAAHSKDARRNRET